MVSRKEKEKGGFWAGTSLNTGVVHAPRQVVREHFPRVNKQQSPSPPATRTGFTFLCAGQVGRGVPVGEEGAVDVWIGDVFGGSWYELEFRKMEYVALSRDWHWDYDQLLDAAAGNSSFLRGYRSYSF